MEWTLVACETGYPVINCIVSECIRIANCDVQLVKIPRISGTVYILRLIRFAKANLIIVEDIPQYILKFTIEAV